MAQRTYSNQFPREYWPTQELLTVLSFLGWKDTSWGNDACPSFESNSYRLWVDAEDPSLRECGNSRYAVMRIMDPEDTSLDELIWQGDDTSELIAVLENIDQHNDLVQLVRAFAAQSNNGALLARAENLIG